MRSKLRQLFMLWRRQTGKSYTLAHCALIRMMRHKNRLITMVSASVNIGGELLLKEAQIWAEALRKYRELCDAQNLKLSTTADDDGGELLDIDAIADIFEHNKLEAKIYHSRGVVSRTRVIAPNPNTAVGWTGDIFMDEIGRIENFRDVYEAVLPIMDSHPEMARRILCAYKIFGGKVAGRFHIRRRREVYTARQAFGRGQPRYSLFNRRGRLFQQGKKRIAY